MFVGCEYGKPRTEERYELTSQIRGAAVSVPSNIAEACGRGSPREVAQFFQIAMGSGCELEYQLLLAHDLGFLPEKHYHQLDATVRNVKRMLAGLLTRVKGKPGRARS